MARAVPTVLILLAGLSITALGESHHAGELSIEPYSLRTFDGAAHPAELGRLWVPVKRGGGPLDRLIQIAFIRLKSTAQKPGSPIVFLPGGPGVPGTVMGRVPVYYDLFQKLQGVSDVILADQRGIGMSVPDTECPKAEMAPVDALAKESIFRDVLIAQARACAEAWRAKGYDEASFSTAESADDLEDLRRALGVEKLSLLAHSYGTSLALETIRRHGEHLDRVVLAGVEGPDHALQMPLVFDFALRRLSAAAAAAPNLHGAYPDTYGEFRKLLDRLNREPLAVRIRNDATKQDVDVKVGPFVVQFLIKNMLPNGRKVDHIPALVYSLASGDSSMLNGMVQELYDWLSSGGTAMAFGVLCSDGWSDSRRRLALEQAPLSVFGDAPFVHLDPRLCSAVGVTPTATDSLLPIWSKVHTLLISGTMDSNTPVNQAEEVLQGLPNAEIAIVENGFHETLPAPEVQAIVTAFFKGADTKRQIVQFDPPRFLTVEEAKAPPRGR